MFIFGGWNDSGIQNIGYIYSYKTGIWKGITLTETINPQRSEYYTQYNNIIYYYVRATNKINTYNMRYPYSNGLSIPLTGITVYNDPCLSVDINGNLFLSSGGFVVLGNTLNYYGYNINDNIWKTFTHSIYWHIYNYDMTGMACIVHNQILYTFGGLAGWNEYVSEYYGSNMISYHDINDYNSPFLLNGYSLWNKSSQDLKPFCGTMRAISVDELIYIIGGWSYNLNSDDLCCIGWLNDVQIFDPNTHTISSKSDGVPPLLDVLHSTTCHFRSTTYTINCLGGIIFSGITNKWIYSNPLFSNQSTLPTQSPSESPLITTLLRPNISSSIPTTFPMNTTTSDNSSNTPDNRSTVTLIIVITSCTCVIIVIIMLTFMCYHYYKTAIIKIQKQIIDQNNSISKNISMSGQNEGQPNLYSNNNNQINTIEGENTKKAPKINVSTKKV